MIEKRKETWSDIKELVDSCNHILEGKTEEGDLENLEKMANAICLIKDKKVNVYGLVDCGVSGRELYNKKVKNPKRELTEEEYSLLFNIFRKEPDMSAFYEPYEQGRYNGD